MAGLISRRFFLAGLGSTGVGLGLGGFSHLFPLSSPQFGPDWSPGDENHVPSTCLLCPSHCGILGRVVDGKLVRVDGNPLHPVSQGGLCPKGRASLQLRGRSRAMNNYFVRGATRVMPEQPAPAHARTPNS